MKARRVNAGFHCYLHLKENISPEMKSTSTTSTIENKWENVNRQIKQRGEIHESNK